MRTAPARSAAPHRFLHREIVRHPSAILFVTQLVGVVLYAVNDEQSPSWRVGFEVSGRPSSRWRSGRSATSRARPGWRSSSASWPPPCRSPLP